MVLVENDSKSSFTLPFILWSVYLATLTARLHPQQAHQSVSITHKKNFQTPPAAFLNVFSLVHARQERAVLACSKKGLSGQHSEASCVLDQLTMWIG